ncbi:conserved Plasmodium protein, unknown function [Plasmodium reichenowi]|uniref:Uncharacterized protein n=1 Tax=Plasmodium reichenowi TaxID=5854 RepID=A0A060S058_PLARE|nr:conserved Plasmodium protein, unknown function [Plasmodium reichenowi]
MEKKKYSGFSTSSSSSIKENLNFNKSYLDISTYNKSPYTKQNSINNTNEVFEFFTRITNNQKDLNKKYEQLFSLIKKFGKEIKYLLSKNDEHNKILVDTNEHIKKVKTKLGDSSYKQYENNEIDTSEDKHNIDLIAKIIFQLLEELTYYNKNTKECNKKIEELRKNLGNKDDYNKLERKLTLKSDELKKEMISNMSSIKEKEDLKMKIKEDRNMFRKDMHMIHQELLYFILKFLLKNKKKKIQKDCFLFWLIMVKNKKEARNKIIKSFCKKQEELLNFSIKKLKSNSYEKDVISKVMSLIDKYIYDPNKINNNSHQNSVNIRNDKNFGLPPQYVSRSNNNNNMEKKNLSLLNYNYPLDNDYNYNMSENKNANENENENNYVNNDNNINNDNSLSNYNDMSTNNILDNKNDINNDNSINKNNYYMSNNNYTDYNNNINNNIKSGNHKTSYINDSNNNNYDRLNYRSNEYSHYSKTKRSESHQNYENVGSKKNSNNNNNNNTYDSNIYSNNNNNNNISNNSNEPMTKNNLLNIFDSSINNLSKKRDTRKFSDDTNIDHKYNRQHSSYIPDQVERNYDIENMYNKFVQEMKEKADKKNVDLLHQTIKKLNNKINDIRSTLEMQKKINKELGKGIPSEKLSLNYNKNRTPNRQVETEYINSVEENNDSINTLSERTLSEYLLNKNTSKNTSSNNYYSDKKQNDKKKQEDSNKNNEYYNRKKKSDILLQPKKTYDYLDNKWDTNNNKYYKNNSMDAYHTHNSTLYNKRDYKKYDERKNEQDNKKYNNNDKKINNINDYNQKYEKKKYDSVYEKKYDSAYEKKYDRSYDKKYDSSYEKKYDSSYEKKYDSAYEKKFDSTYEKKYDSAYEKKYDGAYEKKYDGAYEKKYDGAYEKKYDGAYEKKYDGAYEKKYDGTYEKKNDHRYTKKYENNNMNTYDSNQNYEKVYNNCNNKKYRKHFNDSNLDDSPSDIKLILRTGGGFRKLSEHDQKHYLQKLNYLNDNNLLGYETNLNIKIKGHPFIQNIPNNNQQTSKKEKRHRSLSKFYNMH